MKTEFFKYQGTGNDFIIIDNRKGVVNRQNNALVAKLCNRRFGIGADGLMLLQEKQGYDYEMVYFNSDGNESSMCGNGGRCLAEFARAIGIIKDRARFIAIDGEHEAIIKNDVVSLKMKDVGSIEIKDDFYFLNTGSPHYVKISTDVKSLDVPEEGKKIRYSSRFIAEGTNVNFIEKMNGEIFVRTYERGVEGETLSCGTGVTASALVAALKEISNSGTHCRVRTPGGDLNVYFERSGQSFRNIWLEGPATFVFKGEIEI